MRPLVRKWQLRGSQLHGFHRRIAYRSLRRGPRQDRPEMWACGALRECLGRTKCSAPLELRFHFNDPKLPTTLRAVGRDHDFYTEGGWANVRRTVLGESG